MDRRHALLDPLVVGSVAITARALTGAAADLTLLQWRALVIVAEDGEATIGRVARRIGANSSPVSRLVRRLERRGLVRTRPDGRDRRVTRVELTESGAAIVDRVVAHRLEVLRTIPIPDDDLPALERLARAFAVLG